MQSQNLDYYIFWKWDELYANRDKNKIFRSSLDNRQAKDLKGGIKAIYIEDLLANKRPSQFKVGDVKGNKVYQEFDENKFNYNKIPEEEILFFINLDEEEIYTKEKRALFEADNMERELEEEVSQTTFHPIVLNPSPLMPKHTVIPLFCEEELPQVIGTDMINTILQIFKLSCSPYLRYKKIILFP